MRGLRGTLRSPSLVVAIIALAVALGGTSYAALQLPRNSIGARHIKAGAVGSAEVKNRSLRLRDFAAGTRRALKGPPGEPGPQGLPGSGAAGLPTLVYRSVAANVGEGERRSVLVGCLAGERVTGGGADVRAGDTAVVESYPKADGTGWWLTVENNNEPATPNGPAGGPYAFTVYATCVRANAATG
jgi:hypothetical protein